MTPGHTVHDIHFICTRWPSRPHSALTRCQGSKADLLSLVKQQGVAMRLTFLLPGWAGSASASPEAQGGGKHRAWGPGLASGSQNWAPTTKLRAQCLLTVRHTEVLGPREGSASSLLLSAPGRGEQLTKGTRKHGGSARCGKRVTSTERGVWSGCYTRKAGGAQVLLGPRGI